MEKKVALGILIAVIAFGSAGYLVAASSLEPAQGLTLDQMYRNAVLAAMYPDEGDVCYNLTPIVETNTNLTWRGEGEGRMVRVVIFTKFAQSYPVGGEVNTSWGETWVTVHPELERILAANPNPSMNHTLRVMQLLGLPADGGNRYIVETWVKPGDLFRPSPDSEIVDTTAQLTFPWNASDSHKEWFVGNIVYSYFTKAYPWTRLGYTYNWGGGSAHFGLSEFIIKRGATIIVESVSPVEDYVGG